MREFSFAGSGGTRLVGWRNGGSGPQVLLCNGLAAAAECWPSLLDPGCGYDVSSWHTRGFLGSDRPSSIGAAGLRAQAEDALALLDHVAWDRAIFLGWSFGVNISAEIAIDHPDRITGMVAVAGLPGGTFRALMGRNPLPAEARRRLGIAGTSVGEAQAWGINLIAGAIKNPALVAEILQRTGFIAASANRADVTAMVQPYFGHDYGWYFKMARVLANHEALDISRITVPTEVLVGSADAVTDPRAVEKFGRSLPDANVTLLPGTHFLPVEYPEEIVAALDRLVARLGG